MNPRHLLIIAILIILLTSYSSSDYLKCTCLGKCHGRDVEQSVTKHLKTFSLDTGKCLARAKKAFGGHCGGLADCTSGCVELDINLECEGVRTRASSCCKDWCSGFSGDEEYCGCIQSCEAGCRTSELTGQIISVLQYIAVVIVAIMLAVNGIKFIASDSPHDRDQAKASIRYILIALIILAIVTYMVTALFFPVRVPGGDTSVDDCTATNVAPSAVTLLPGTVLGSPVSPVPTCSSAYYLRTSPTSGTCKWHDGIDLAVACGTSMVAPVTGRVVRAGSISGYGNAVVINIADSDVIVFTAHMESVSVGVGDEVVAGSTNIGKSGDTGTPGSCHIHLGTHTGYTSGVPSLDKCCGISCGDCKGPCSQDPRNYFTMFGTCAQNSPCTGTVCYT